VNNIVVRSVHQIVVNSKSATTEDEQI
jgi:hypothetical protein